MRRLARAVAVAVILLPALAAPAGAERLAYSNSNDIVLFDTVSRLKSPIASMATQERDPSFSPDGSQIAFGSGNQIGVMNADGSNRILHANTLGSASTPEWRPDGSEIAYLSGNGEFRARKPDGTGDRLVWDPDPGAFGGPDRIGSAVGNGFVWAPDGTRLAVGVSPSGVGADFEIWTVGPNGESPVKLTGGNVAAPAFSPDGSRIAFWDIANHQLGVMNADGSARSPIATSGLSPSTLTWTPNGENIVFSAGTVQSPSQTDLYTVPVAGGVPQKLTDDAEPESNPDFGPSTQVIFVHGFLGSKIYCGAEELWPNLPLPKLPKMELGSDGRSNAGCASAGPRGEEIVEEALGSDVYRSTADFLRGAFPGVHFYAWDWRKSPEEAIAGLDALVDRARAASPDGKVVLMAHSMGGLVTRLYVNDQTRANKVSRVLTAGTPYWGSPKALFPFLYGVESPGLSTLDVIFDNDELRSFARYLQGMFFLWPSARYGGWLSIEGRSSPLTRPALLDFVDEFGGNRSLLSTALGAHAQRIDALATGGTDYQVVVGSGVHTIGAVKITPSPAALPTRLRRDIVHIDWVNGDGTVPLRSAVGPWPDVRRHFTCGVSHVPLPGHPAFTTRARQFLAGEGVFEDPGTPTQRKCDAQGFALSIFPLANTVFASSTARHARVSQAGGALTLEQAEQLGTLEAVVRGPNIEAATSGPLELTLPTKGGALLRLAPMKNGKQGKGQIFLASGRGALKIDLTGKVVVRHRGKKLRGRRDDQRPPKTKVLVKRRGSGFLLAFKVKDASPTTTYATFGKRTKLVKHDRLRVSAKQLRKGVRYQSVDALGNTEKRKRIRPR